MKCDYPKCDQDAIVEWKPDGQSEQDGSTFRCAKHPALTSEFEIVATKDGPCARCGRAWKQPLCMQGRCW